MGILKPAKYGENFHDLYLNNPHRSSTNVDHVEYKDKLKRHNKLKDNLQIERSSQLYSAPRPEVNLNSSKFAVFSAVRASILEAETKFRLQSASSCTVCEPYFKYCHCRDKQSDTDDETDDDENSERESVLALPQIVGAGLKGLFELIVESQRDQPLICAKALRALFDVIQGQDPEGFKNEPSDIIDSLYDLLMNLSTSDTIADCLSAISCSTLIALCVSRGDTGKTLKAIASLLMSPKQLNNQLIQIPVVLQVLQKTVISAVQGHPKCPTLYRNGIKNSCLIDKISLKKDVPYKLNYNVAPSIASDGKFLYILSGRTLMKIGTGYNNSQKGYIYAINNEFGKDKIGWIGYCMKKLFYKRLSKKGIDTLLVVDTESLQILTNGQVAIPSLKDPNNSFFFSDGDSINAIYSGKDDMLFIKQLYSNGPATFDLPLKLTVKSFRVLGYASFEEELLNHNQISKIQTTYNAYGLKLPKDLDVENIVCGKEFGLILSKSGNVYYFGKPNSLGFKVMDKPVIMRPIELDISNSAKPSIISMGHDGLHAVIVNDDGTCYFTGVARRGEDGEIYKNRRQPKALKPRKINKIEPHYVVHAASNNGTSAFVTNNGKVYLYGKDISYCDGNGFVVGLLQQHITKVALGKAHCVALNSKGQVFTFGLNNKGQCGYYKIAERDGTKTVAMDLSDQREIAERQVKCDFDEHTLVQDKCRICYYCRECTGYNISCTSTQNIPHAERTPLSNCGCGPGDSGCSKCGACLSCISLLDPADLNGADHKNNDLNFTISFIRRNNKGKEKKTQENVQTNENDKELLRVPLFPPSRLTLPSSSPVVQIACGLHHSVVLTMAGEVYTFGSNQYGQLGTGDLQPSFGPFAVKIPGVVTQIAAGSNHTVVLESKGNVYTFGNFQKGQLGRLPNDYQQGMATNMNEDGNKKDGEFLDINDILMHRQRFLWNCIPTLVKGIGPAYSKKATWIAACADQTFIKIDDALLTASSLSRTSVVADKETILLYPQHTRSFKCLAVNRNDGVCQVHNGNQIDFSKIGSVLTPGDASMQLVSDHCNSNLDKEFQSSFNRMSQSVHEARNKIFDIDASSEKQSDNPCKQLAFTLDTNFGILWVFDGIARELSCYNVIAGEEPFNPRYINHLKTILTPSLALPMKSESMAIRSLVTLNLLACLDVLTSVNDSIPKCFETETQNVIKPAKDFQNDDYKSVSRFEGFGGGWQYSGHSIEAIRFSANKDVLIYGFGLFGGRGEYTCKIKLYDLGMDGGYHEGDGDLLAETDEIPFECAAQQKFNVVLNKPVAALANRWYLVCARISGPSSDCGSCGLFSVTTEDQVSFSFKSSRKSNNSTDIHSGQIPSILYKVVTQETKKPTVENEEEVIRKISKMFASTVTKDGFENLILLLDWSWTAFKKMIYEKKRNSEVLISLNRHVYITKSCLRILKKYMNSIYPDGQNTGVEKYSFRKVAAQKEVDPGEGPSSGRTFAIKRIHQTVSVETPTQSVRKFNMESISLAECVGDVRALLIRMLCDVSLPETDVERSQFVSEILSECHETFVACFNAFYPTNAMKWDCLCEELMEMDVENLHPEYLSAILSGLCNPIIRLRSTFSLMSQQKENKPIISPSDNIGMSITGYHQYPVLVEQMLNRSDKEKNIMQGNDWTFKDVLSRLLDIIALPVKQKIESLYIRTSNSPRYSFKDIGQTLIDNCCHLISRVLGEIVLQICSPNFDLMSLPPKELHTTGSRFGRIDASRTWNTGNFGPEAIAFSVDRPGVVICGAEVYYGSGNYEYQLEIFSESDVAQPDTKWELMESINGLYDQESMVNDTVLLKFDRPIHIKDRVRYAIRFCCQGARTCSGDNGASSLQGPCGTMFNFYPCDLSFNGTTPSRGQIPSIMYYISALDNESNSGKTISESQARELALEITSDITKRCTELLISASNALMVSLSPNSDKSSNSSNNTQTIDSEHNITPIEEHLDINWSNNMNVQPHITENALSTARDFTKRIESFSKGLIETLKFDKRSTNPFDFEIGVGATEIQEDNVVEVQERNIRNGELSKINGNNRPRSYIQDFDQSDSDEDTSSHIMVMKVLEFFNLNKASIFYTLLPLVYAHIGSLANKDPQSSVHILSLVREILPHVSSLNRIYMTNNQLPPKNKPDSLVDLCTTSNHYCVVESEHPYKPSTLTIYRVEFPPCVHWFTIEFDPQCGTAQPEDCFHVSIPVNLLDGTGSQADQFLGENKRVDVCKSVELTTTVIPRTTKNKNNIFESSSLWQPICKYDSTTNWIQRSLVLPGNVVELSLMTASTYASDPLLNKFGFKCLIVGYDNLSMIKYTNNCLAKLEYELAYLGGMCSANLMKRDLPFTDEKFEEIPEVDLNEMGSNLTCLLSKGFALPDRSLTIQQALEQPLPLKVQSNERQFLIDFVNGAPGSAGGRLAAWLQPEPRVDTNKCELRPFKQPVQVLWPCQLMLTTRDQYGEVVAVPNLKVEVKITPPGAHNYKSKANESNDGEQDKMTLPKVSYEPVIKDKMSYNAVCFMKPYQNLSFEEMRYMYNIPNRVFRSEVINLLDLGDGLYSSNWIPTSSGTYSITVGIDGIPIEEVYRIEVKDAAAPPPQSSSSVKNSQRPTKLRKFIEPNSAGLRIRAHPTLQSEQVGILKVNGIISFIDELENDDGIWVRLSTEAIRLHCTTGWYPTEAWCLQYNQHTGKTLLHPYSNSVTELESHATDENELNNMQQINNPNLNIRQNDEEFLITQENSTNNFIFSTTNPSVNESSEDKEQTSDGQSVIDLDQNLIESPSVDENPAINLNLLKMSGLKANSNAKQQIQKWFKADVDDVSNVKSSSSGRSITPRSAVEVLKSDAASNLGSKGFVVPPSPKHMPKQQRKNKNEFTVFSSTSESSITQSNMQPTSSNVPKVNEPPSVLGQGIPLNETNGTKRALPPCMAQSLRSVFAAFVWHEGIVHDAMACASFLKFHPNLPKQGVPIIPRDGSSLKCHNLSREEKAQHRHSVEVANTGAYLNIRPSTLETLTKSGNSSVYNRRYRKTSGDDSTGDGSKLRTAPNSVTVLPPSLRCLLYLWEQVCSQCIQVAHNGFQDNGSAISTPVRPPRSLKETSVDVAERDTKRNRKKKKDDGSWCEMCGIYLPIPVTYHMRIVHPGCGNPAKGKGYNSVGTFCEGWAGNCGEGGKGASSWYLMCMNCRDKYMSNNKGAKNTSVQTFGNMNKVEDLLEYESGLMLKSNLYTKMKENALFLLDLASTDNCALADAQKRVVSEMGTVNEGQLAKTPMDFNRPGTSQMFETGDIRSHRLSMNQHRLPTISSTPQKKYGPYNGPYDADSIWQIPPTLSCLESLGVSMNKDAIGYEGFGHSANEHGVDRPLSDLSFDSCWDPTSSDIKSTTSSVHQANTKFHRSRSMGQGWQNATHNTAPNKFTGQAIDDGEVTNEPKVVMRRRNHSSCDEGSLLMCYPSENLKKLVPKTLLSVVAVRQSDDVRDDSTNAEKLESDHNKSSNEAKPNESKLTENDALDKAESKESIVASRPCIAFVMRDNDLKKLMGCMERSLRIATCRVYALQALNWLMRTVTQPISLHDLMWWFVTALTPRDKFNVQRSNDVELALDHPIMPQMSGRMRQCVSQVLHNYLQTVAELTLLLPPGSSLQRVAIQNFGMKFRQGDHQFLHRSHVFGNISKILSRSDEQNEDNIQSVSACLESSSGQVPPGFRMSHLVDLQGMFNVVVSSRTAMAASLTDNSTETFWESDEENRSKPKIVELALNTIDYVCKLVAIHIDNSRDVQTRVTNIDVSAGSSSSDFTFLTTIETDNIRCGQWYITPVEDENIAYIRLEFRGLENTLRVRQIKLMGTNRKLDDDALLKSQSKYTTSLQIQQKNCEAETLRVFRLLTSQVFGKLILPSEDASRVSGYGDGLGLELSMNEGDQVLETSAGSLLTDSLDLREHMVGILFSRSKLSHLQKQVIVHIVNAIRTETQKTREEWEIQNVNYTHLNISSFNSDQRSECSTDHSRSPDTYCFEMLSMVLALSGSSVGRSYLAHQHGLLRDLLSLLHTGSDRVQRQVSSLLRRILQEITPETFGDLLGVAQMPPFDFSIMNTNSNAFDMTRLGFLDIFLAVIAKSLHLQVKVKSASQAPNKNPPNVQLSNCIDLNVSKLKQRDISDESLADDSQKKLFEASEDEPQQLKLRNIGKNLNQRWFLKGCISMKQSENIINLIKDMSGGKLGENWARVTKAAIAESILNLTRLDEIYRNPEICLKTPTLWMALASLCVLDKEHVERLSSSDWSKNCDTRPMCSNHDDGVTPAVIHCEECGSLCADCDRFLHLNRKTRLHHRTVCKEEEEAIRVELHESCGRTKLFWLLVLADSRTLKGVVEFRDRNNGFISGTAMAVGCCRFCGITGNSGLLAVGNVCADAQCQEHASNACIKLKSCGHVCNGVINELNCLPCLNQSCHDPETSVLNTEAGSSKLPKLTQDGDDMCMICFIEALSNAPSVQLDCGHVFHYHCCRAVLQKRWTGPRISFGFSQCPICKIDISHALLTDLLEPIISLKNDVKRKALMRLEYEGLGKGSDHKDLVAYAMDRYAYYVCYKCQKAYYGGEARCDVEMGDNFNPEELVCGGCSDVARAQMCPKHGTDYLEYKCRYCCSVAVFFCFGTTHFCDTCHDDFQRLTNIPKHKLPKCPAGPKSKQLMCEECPLHIVHPPTGEEFALGCGICRNAQTF